MGVYVAEVFLGMFVGAAIGFMTAAVLSRGRGLYEKNPTVGAGGDYERSRDPVCLCDECAKDKYREPQAPPV